MNFLYANLLTVFFILASQYGYAQANYSKVHQVQFINFTIDKIDYKAIYISEKSFSHSKGTAVMRVWYRKNRSREQ